MDAFKHYLETRTRGSSVHLEDPDVRVRLDALDAQMQADYRQLRRSGYSPNAAIGRVLSDVRPRLELIEKDGHLSDRSHTPVESYLRVRRRSAWTFASATAICILAVLPLVILSGLFVSRLGTGAVVLFGMAAFLTLLGFGLVHLTRANRRFEEAMPIEHLALGITPQIRHWLRTDVQIHRRRWGFELVLCLLAWTGLIVLLRFIRTGALPHDPTALTVLFGATVILLALALSLLVSLCVELSAYTRLVHREERLAGQRPSARAEATRRFRSH